MIRSPREMEVARTALTSRVENMEVGVCPICHSSMEKAAVDNIPCFTCIKCRIALPTPDTESTF